MKKLVSEHLLNILVTYSTTKCLWSYKTLKPLSCATPGKQGFLIYPMHIRLALATRGSNTTGARAPSIIFLWMLSTHNQFAENPISTHSLKQACPTFLARGPKDKFRQS